jgi:hypothetical protein
MNWRRKEDRLSPWYFCLKVIMVWMSALVIEGMAKWKVWNVEEDEVNVMKGYEGAVVKYPSQSKSGENAKDPKMKVGEIVKNISENNKALLIWWYTSSYLQLLAIQEGSMKRLVEVRNGKEDDDKDREAKRRCWTRERGLEEISIKREEREKLGLILVVERELRDFKPFVMLCWVMFWLQIYFN